LTAPSLWELESELNANGNPESQQTLVKIFPLLDVRILGHACRIGIELGVFQLIDPPSLANTLQIEVDEMEKVLCQ
jgi:hypothetical protein